MRAPLPPLAAAAIAVILACPVPASAQKGWLMFNSEDVLPRSSGIAFTMWYPPDFRKIADMDRIISGKDIDDNSTAEVRIVQAFRQSVPDNGMISIFGANLFRYYKERSRRLIERYGYVKFWNGVGTRVEDELIKFDGSSPADFNGHEAVNLFFTYRKDPNRHPSQGGIIQLLYYRIVPVDDTEFVLACHAVLPADIARARAYTSRSNPAARKYCEPFFNSLKVRS
jgi:hypothetical protein